MTDADQPRHHVGRRRLVQGAAGGLAAGAAIGLGAGWGAGSASAAGAPDDHDTVDLSTQHPFYDEARPAGIKTPQQRYAVYMTFDLAQGALRSDLQVLLARWTAAIAQLMKGAPIGQVDSVRPGAIGQDTGEAAGLDAASLTVTVGLGPGLFDERFGLSSKKPALLADLPALPSDNLVAASSGGDLSLQACADDPQVAYHAVRNLARMVRGTAMTRWAVLGFGRASAGKGQETPRNLLGFKDGTRNLRSDADYDEFVWVDDASEQAWLRGGTYQVVRKISMNIEVWDADPINDQQSIFGRTKNVGAPLTGHGEFDTPNFHSRNATGKTVIPADSHVALAAHENNGGVKIMRRGYNYTEGINGFGQLDAGLLFIAYMSTPQHFVTLQSKLGASDRLNEYISHVGSGLFAVPPAPKSGHYIGEQLFA
ncbi:iron uptake transporter deferrochelatase/peroxidase subunit [Allobranchiibius sp. GilTou73]|uniref:iron uptake transporter deferrochelatase/peroxidase subunit n=1 Tax=Allobranchiibius sp. GilTou73 TaxID=2904523 RepID=UPI001F1AAC55|nr:iron uptake transporter deferrochelatase/peroxidase subunit [Allobranchiibius sp. GilTou73]UIJ34213.1 iron uptake transporter deferrochelatase/peroxidase subunit [Allobranchiibius sp. GilTou73]